ncbi:MAG: S8 family serine peptidase [Marinoscillum sp.]
MFKNLTLSLLVVFVQSIACFGQEKFWISNEDRYLITVDLPAPDYCSEWINQCSYRLDTKTQSLLHELDIDFSPVHQFTPTSSNETYPTLGFALEQVESKAFIDRGLTGKGVKIGIIDGGFLGAKEDPSLKHFFDKNLVKYYKDYITPNMEEYGGAIGLDDNHGTEVWQAIGGFHPSKNILYGLATESEYYLARTDHGAYEKRIEEDFLIKALEDMAKMNIKLINISLGYNLGFNDPKENYEKADMDGKTSALAKAVDHGALKKGMLIVVAAGNEGMDKWETLSTPGDARHALTVGSSKYEIWDKMNYSSIGPEFTDFVKPDVSVYSTMGTSYSTPIVTGMAACIWQLNPQLTNFEIIEIFKKAGNFYPFPNNYLGYGVPSCPKLLSILEGEEQLAPETIRTSKDHVKIDIQDSVRYIVAFHKKDERNVSSRVVYKSNDRNVKVKKMEDAHQTSVLVGKSIVEIIWE